MVFFVCRRRTQCFCSKASLLYIFHFISSYDTHLRTRRRQLSVLGKWCSVSPSIFLSTAVGQAAACTCVRQQVRVRSPVGTSFLGEIFIGVFPHLSDKCWEALGPQGPRISYGHHYHHHSSFNKGANDLRC